MGGGVALARGGSFWLDISVRSGRCGAFWTILEVFGALGWPLGHVAGRFGPTPVYVAVGSERFAAF